MSFFTSATFRPDCSVGYLLRRAHQLSQIGMEPVFAAEQLTAIQWSALMAILIGTATNSAELARDINYDKGATTRLVDVLEMNGWITRTRDPGDRRIITLALTAAGIALAERVRGQVVVLWNAWLAEWAPQDVDALLGMLRRLRDTLETAERQHPALQDRVA